MAYTCQEIQKRTEGAQDEQEDGIEEDEAQGKPSPMPKGFGDLMRISVRSVTA